MIKKVYAFLIFLVSLPLSAFAQLGLGRAQDIADSNSLFEGTATDIIKAIILWLLSLSAIVALAALVWAGFLYISAFTNEDNTKRAKEIAKYAIIGLLFMGFSFVIISVIEVLLVG